MILSKTCTIDDLAVRNVDITKLSAVGKGGKGGIFIEFHLGEQGGDVGFFRFPENLTIGRDQIQVRFFGRKAVVIFHDDRARFDLNNIGNAGVQGLNFHAYLSLDRFHLTGWEILPLKEPLHFNLVYYIPNYPYLPLGR